MANTIHWNWKSYFSSANIAAASRGCATKDYAHFTYDEQNHRWAKLTTGGKQHNYYDVSVSELPTNYEEAASFRPWIPTAVSAPYAQYRKRDRRFSCTCSLMKSGTMCMHIAMLMFCLENAGIRFTFTETPEEETRRIQRDLAQREAERLEREKQQLLKQEFSVFTLLKEQKDPVPPGIGFPPDLPVLGFKINGYEKRLAEQMEHQKVRPSIEISVNYIFSKSPTLSARGTVEDCELSASLDRGDVCRIKCSCGRMSRYNSYYTSSEYSLCAHAFLFYSALWDRILSEDPDGVTDRSASGLLDWTVSGKSLEAQPSQPERNRCVSLQPYVTLDKQKVEPVLSFFVGREGQRQYVLRNFTKFTDAHANHTVYELSKNASLDFGEVEFTEESEKWYRFIVNRVREIDQLNDKIQYNSFYTYSAGGSIPLRGSTLDLVYSMVEGQTLACRGVADKEIRIPVGDGRLSVNVRLELVREKDSVLGVRISGTLPRTMQGNTGTYILDERQFGQIQHGTMAVLAPFRTIAQDSTEFSCIIGRRRFADFFYRLLPRWEETPEIHIENLIGELPPGLLPPEPVFTFYLDLKDGRISCLTTASYDDTVYDICDPVGGAGRDHAQESRVLKAVSEYFPISEDGDPRLYAPESNETLPRILTDGVSSLSGYGTVKGSGAFQSVKVCTTTSSRVSVSIEGGLLNLSIQTKDLDKEELLALLESYELHKRWYRLKSGSFVDLQNTPDLRDISDLSKSLEIAPRQLINGNISMPAYRALYVDRLLEEHNEIAASRDRNFKSLIRSFRTISDSDFEVSSALKDILRPYQLYGFRWLSTLAQNSLGGILADEMGLGKTVQMLALVESLKRNGEKRPSLVVCPASLVYNWQDEARRFTPSLSVQALAKSASHRKKQIQAGGSVDLFVTSYDALKRDILLLENMEFAVIVLDEAQYIKNRATAAAKSVKVLKGSLRFAMTGTPIENRLSELWSIFDFLMPGFLYSSKEFGSRFETPIMKKKDPDATRRLSAMTEPFLLRRKKADVLKDLPEKLEEIQRQEMQEEQRRLYDAQVVHTKECLNSSSDSPEDRLRVLAEITRLRQLCCDPSLMFENYHGSSAKREAALELVQRAMDDGHRMLIFSQFTSMLALLEKDLTEAGIPYFVLTGSTPKQERIRLVNEFNSGDTPVFLVSLKAGGTGLNLTGADVVIHYDPWWNLAVQNQATDRAHRIGQTKKVTVIKLIAADTIEEKIIELQNAKQDLADAIMGGTGSSLLNLSKEELLSLLT